MDIPDHEVTVAIDDAAHDVAIRMQTNEFERVSAAKAPDVVHVVSGSRTRLSRGGSGRIARIRQDFLEDAARSASAVY